MEDEHWSEADVRRDLSSRTDYQRYSTNRHSMQPEAIIRRAYRDILGRDPDPEGMRTYRSNIIDRNWSEQDVREALRNSPEYASGGARTASADRIIRRAYQDILGREPDASGLETYRRNIVERGWDEQDVRTALRRSQERREVVRGARSVSDAEAADMVRRAYQTVLKREPDAGGMQEYKARILNDRWTEQQVVSALRSSPERREVARAQRNISDAEAADIVRRAYRSVLNREPDAAGMQDYKARIMNDRWTEQQLVNALRNSDEYRSKH
jgi:TorA maturation chaperone TorD